MKREEWMEAAEPSRVAIDEDERRFVYNAQFFLRLFTTSLKNYTFCHLPKCRRARACMGEHAPETYSDNFYNRFPPCVRNLAGQQRLLAEITRVHDELIAANPELDRELTEEELDAVYAELER